MTVLLLFAILGLIAMNGFFVAAEYALVRTRSDRVEAAAERGDKNADLFLRQKESIDEYIAACQVGITMASIGLGAVGEPTIAELLKKPLGGPLAHATAAIIAGILAYLIITSLHITYGELVPKVYTVVHAEGVGRRFARPLQFFRRLFNPFIIALTGLADLTLKPLGVDPETAGDEETTSEDLKFLIARSQHGGQLDPGEAHMLEGVFHLHEQEARNVMTPIPAVVTVDVSDNVEMALRKCVQSGHTRLVVTENQDTDRIRGTVHSNSLARLLMNRGPDAVIEPLVKDALIIPETKPLDDLLADLQRERASMAIVVDEYGRTAGIVTVEDIIEEIVGEIADETDPAAGAVRRLANGDWFVRGHVPITDLLDYGLELPVDTDAYNSVGGFVFGELGRLPKRGDTVQFNGYSLRVESVRENRVEAVRIRHSTDDTGEIQVVPGPTGP
ncbi:MAG: magnesium and cobalt exporter, family [Thermoleophilaceae bacterium]|jgi:CBS domain containing-hemolysin-like protein|nr:magnesium and cobalt exporter, family [Thermoleophilaceae bacterium]